MKKEFSKGQKMLFWYFIICIVVWTLCIPLGKKIREDQQYIETNGKIGMCVLTNKQLTGRITDASAFYVHYEYMINGVEYHCSQDFTDRIMFDYGIVGMKYEIKYLEDNPKKSLIFLEKPIETEYKNIEKERQRMKETGGYKRGLESAKPIETIKMWYPQYFE